MPKAKTEAPARIADAIGERFRALFSHASRGDPAAQREWIRMRQCSVP